jgi:hypothetical protein
MSLRKDMNVLVSKARAVGWTVQMTRNSHLEWKSPDGQHLLYSGSSPSDWRGLKNLESQLQSRGVPVKT